MSRVLAMEQDRNEQEQARLHMALLEQTDTNIQRLNAQLQQMCGERRQVGHRPHHAQPSAPLLRLLVMFSAGLAVGAYVVGWRPEGRPVPSADPEAAAPVEPLVDVGVPTPAVAMPVAEPVEPSVSEPAVTEEAQAGPSPGPEPKQPEPDGEAHADTTETADTETTAPKRIDPKNGQFEF